LHPDTGARQTNPRAQELLNRKYAEYRKVAPKSRGGFADDPIPLEEPTAPAQGKPAAPAQGKPAAPAQGKPAAPAQAKPNVSAQATTTAPAGGNFQSRNTFGHDAKMIGEIGIQNNYAGMPKKPRGAGQRIGDAARAVHDAINTQAAPEKPNNPYDRTSVHLQRSLAKRIKKALSSPEAIVAPGRQSSLSTPFSARSMTRTQAYQAKQSGINMNRVAAATTASKKTPITLPGVTSPVQLFEGEHTGDQVPRGNAWAGKPKDPVINL